MNNNLRKFEIITDPIARSDQFGNDTFEALLPKCFDYWRYDEQLATETILKYGTSLRRILMDLPHITSPLDLRLEDITELKKTMIDRGVGPAGINSAVFALRKFLTYCRDVQKLNVVDPKEIQKAKDKAREVTFLAKDEVISFFKVMNIKTKRGLRMRALCQLLISTGMRISEALSLNIKDIDYEKREAVIVGKGDKQRTIYFTDESLKWIRLYLNKRKDDHPALFITSGQPRRLKRYDLSKTFLHYTKLAGLTKRVHPHILRHSFTTIMINNGCDIFHIKNLLGHSDIKTTAKYYLGIDKSATKAAHAKYLKI